MKLAWLLWLASVLPGPTEERVCLAATVYLEARDQPELGQRAVAEVAFRRFASTKHGDSLCDVVKARKQFAPGIVSPNYRVRAGRAWDRAWEVAGTALAMWTRPRNERDEVVPGADHFYAHNLVQPAWAPEVPLAVIGDHAFVRLGL